jgi:hypothetical protein
MRFPRRILTPFLRFVILAFLLASTLSYAGSPNSTQALRCRPGQMWFGLVFVGQTTTVPAVLTNIGSTGVTVSAMSQAGSGFSVSGLSLPLTLSPGQTVPFSVSFSPQAGGHVDATFGFTSASGLTLSLNVHGTGAIPGLLTANPPSVDFGTVAANTATRNVTIRSALGRDIVSQVIVTGSGFSIAGINLPVILGWGQTATFSVTFTPQSSGVASGSVTILSNGSAPSLTIPLAGTGGATTAGSLSAAAPSLSFGSVQVGSSQILSETLTNSGGSSVAISQVTTAAPYSITGMSLPATLAVGQSATFSVKFTPTTAGSASGNLSVSSNASNPTMTVPLYGAGLTPGSLTATATNLSFGGVQVGNGQTLSETLTNSGGSTVTITAATTASPYSVTGLTLPTTLAAGQSTTFGVMFTPTTGGSASGNLSITSNASNPTLTVPLSGTGVTPGSLTATATSLSFGSVQVGSDQTLSESLTNSGGSSVTITQATTAAPYSVSGLSLPMTLIPGQSFTFGAVFAPTSVGSVSGSISVVSNATNPNLAVSLSGTGTAAGQLTISPATLSFGSVVVGQSKSMAATLSATGSSLTISSASTGSSEFALSGISFPLNIAAGQSASVTVTFTPQASGTASDNASFVSNAANTPVESLTGTGTAPPQHSVDLTWGASTSSVMGYNVYRSGTSGGPYTKINSVPDALTSYTDSTVLGGQTYYYVSTALDAGGMESGFSNEVKATIPAP